MILNQSLKYFQNSRYMPVIFFVQKPNLPSKFSSIVLIKKKGEITMFVLKSSSVEYQGISIIKKDIVTLQKCVNKYYKNVKVKDNLHLCLQYFGVTKKIDDCINKESQIIPFQSIGKQVVLPIIGIGEYRKNGKIMNIALLVDDSHFPGIQVGDKTLFDYEMTDCPNITVYVCKDTYIDNKNRIHPVTAVKKSDKCFIPEKLEEGETSNFIAFKEPVYVSGQLAMFFGQQPAYHVDMNAPRLITRKQINEDINELMNAEFVNEWEQQKQEQAEDIENKLFQGV